MTDPFVTLIADRKADYDGAGPEERYPLLHITFMEESYDSTCLAIQTIVDALPSLHAGDEMRVQFIHARPEYSSTWEGEMPSRHEATGICRSEASERALLWREFVRDVYCGTRP
jgi:hypothetical protein